VRTNKIIGVLLMKKMIFAIGIAVLCSYVHAEIIELDTYNPDHCRQQILSSNDNAPVVLAYFEDCEPAKQFIKNVYEPVAKEHPDRAFFKFNADPNASDWQAYSQCLQLLGHVGSPTAMLYYKAYDIGSHQSLLFGPVRAGGSGYMTKEEFLKMIDPYMIKRGVSFKSNKK
jgi:hypothetical protein